MKHVWDEFLMSNVTREEEEEEAEKENTLKTGQKRERLSRKSQSEIKKCLFSLRTSHPGSYCEPDKQFKNTKISFY